MRDCPVEAGFGPDPRQWGREASPSLVDTVVSEGEAVRMETFEYMRPGTVSEAVALLAEKPGRARAMAGGTDLLVQMKVGRRHVDRVVDVKGISELSEIRVNADGSVTIGAAVPAHKVYAHPAIVAGYAGIIDSASIVGGVAIQGRASLGGNLCNAAPSGDTIPSLAAVGATAVIAGPSGRREVPVAEFCTGPGQNCMHADELLVAINLPAPKPRSAGHYLRFIPRNEMDIAVAGAGAWVALDDQGVVTEARVVLASVAPVPLSVPEAAAAVVGTHGDDAALEAASAAAKAAARPITDMRGTVEQRRHLSGVMAKRALAGAIARARGEHVAGAHETHATNGVAH